MTATRIPAAELEAHSAIYGKPIEADYAEGLMYLVAAGRTWTAPIPGLDPTNAAAAFAAIGVAAGVGGGAA